MIGLEGAERDALLVTQIQEIGAHLRLAQLIGRAHVVGGQRANGLKVVGLGSSRQAGHPHVLDHTLTQRCHLKTLLSSFQARTHDQALEKILPSQAHRDGHSPYGEAVQSNDRFSDATESLTLI